MEFAACDIMAQGEENGGRGAAQRAAKFHPVSKCGDLAGRENQSVVSDLDGTLMRSSSSFPYFMLMAFEAGGPLRALLLLLASPLVWVLYYFVSEAAGVQVMIFWPWRE